MFNFFIFLLLFCRVGSVCVGHAGQCGQDQHHPRLPGRCSGTNIEKVLSLIFMKNSSTVPLGSWVQIHWNFFDIFFRYWKMACFRFRFFFKCTFILWTNIVNFLQCIDRTPWTQNRCNFFDILYRSWNINNSIFEFFTVRLTVY